MENSRIGIVIKFKLSPKSGYYAASFPMYFKETKQGVFVYLSNGRKFSSKLSLNTFIETVHEINKSS